MTEEEAKTKWCPFARLIATPEHEVAIPRYDGTAGFNRYSGDARQIPGASCCIGSACMAWRVESRWHSQPGTLGRETDTPDLIGFCGLAGRPQ